MVNNNLFQFGEVNSAHAFPHHLSTRLNKHAVGQGALPLRIYGFNQCIFVFRIEDIVLVVCILFLQKKQGFGCFIRLVGRNGDEQA